MGERISVQVLSELRRVAVQDLDFHQPIEPLLSLKADLQLDSLGLTIVAVALENRFRIKLNEEDAGTLETVQDLINLVERRLNEATE